MPISPIQPPRPSWHSLPGSTTKNSHLYLSHCSTPSLLLWWCHRPPLAFLCSLIESRGDRCIGTVKIQQEGEWSRFIYFHAVNCMTPSTIHHNLLSSLNQTPPNSTSLLPTCNGIKQCAAFTEPSTVAFPTSIAWIGNEKTHISTCWNAVAVPGPVHCFLLFTYLNNYSTLSHNSRHSICIQLRSSDS